MKTLTITMKWNKAQQKWLMCHRGIFFYDFWDCGNVRLAFPGITKEHISTYKLTIEPIREEEDG